MNEADARDHAAVVRWMAQTVVDDVRADHCHLDLAYRVTVRGADVQWSISVAGISADRRELIQTILEHACECFGLFPASASYVADVLSVGGTSTVMEV